MQTARKNPQPHQTARPTARPTASTNNGGVKKPSRKPGRPKGKAGKWKPAPKGKKKAIGKQPKFPFMKLLPELRNEIYSLVLPKRITQSNSGGWVSMDDTPNEFMNLLLVNKQVSDEARTVLYGHNTFTMVATKHRTLLLGSLIEHNFLPFPTKPSISFIKNWQIALWPNYRNLRGKSAARFCDAVLSACSQIAKAHELQTLTLSIPCVCEHLREMRGQCNCPRGRCQCDSQEIGEIHENMVALLAPFNQLRFKGKVQIVAAAQPPRRSDAGAAILRTVSYSQSDDKDKQIKLSRYPHHQCQQPLCLSFAASFDPVRAMLMGHTTPLSLTKDQADWFDLKKIFQEHSDHPHCSRTLTMEALLELWNALNSGSAEYWFGVRDRLEKQVLRKLLCLREKDDYLGWENASEDEDDDW
ncbi:MAG: hypothetical protein Q9168_006901 [Polycauliona sp. 1 TL-2023]